MQRPRPCSVSDLTELQETVSSCCSRAKNRKNRCGLVIFNTLCTGVPGVKLESRISQGEASRDIRVPISKMTTKFLF